MHKPVELSVPASSSCVEASGPRNFPIQKPKGKMSNGRSLVTSQKERGGPATLFYLLFARRRPAP